MTILFLASMFLAIIGPSMTAQACSCVSPDPAEFLRTSDFVFAGSLVSRTDGAIGESGLGDFNNVAFTFDVDTIYKGDLRDATVDVWSAGNGAACGFEVPPGEPVGIAASFQDGKLTGGLCATMGADELDLAAEQAGIEARTPPDTSPSVASPAPDTDGDESSEANAPVWSIAAVAGLAVIVTTGMLRFRTRRD